jgi:Lon protease-like protein
MSAPLKPAETFEIPVFPLPETVLFPGTLLPLHVFEPRYRTLLARCLDSDRRMGVALLKPGWESEYYGAPTIHPLFGVGEIVDHVPLSDGTSDIVLRGACRVRLVGYKQEKPFRIAIVQTAPESHDALGFEDPVSFMKAAFASGLPRGLAHVVANLLGLDAQPFGRVVDVVCSTLVSEPSLRQALLETLDAEQRLWRLGSVLEERGSGGPMEGPVDPSFPESSDESMN